MVKKRCTFKNMEENLKKPGRNSKNLEKISKKPLATLYLPLKLIFYLPVTVIITISEQHRQIKFPLCGIVHFSSLGFRFFLNF